jgi:hypothetical protein
VPAPGAPSPPGPALKVDALVEALTGLRSALHGVHFPLPVPGVEQARADAVRILTQLDDYLVPRLARLDAPLLVVVGGPTGAGKSTLVNSVVRAPVSPSGVLRPTTMAPVLVSHPADSTWYAEGQLLPGLPRSTGLTAEADTLRMVAAPGMIPGLALLDSPDLDSVVSADRAMAEKLLGAADLWLFVTTAARYADAVPWDALTLARDRGTALAIVLDRVPRGAERQVAGHLDELLDRHGLEAIRRFGLPETEVDGQGLLPERLVDPLCTWLAQLAKDPAARAEVVRHTLRGAIAALTPALELLATAADDQSAATTALSDVVPAAGQAALTGVDRAASDGTLLRGEALTRWQEFVADGELVRALHDHLGRLRDRMGAALTPRAVPGRLLREALAAGLVTVIVSAAADTEDQVRSVWRTQPGLLAAVPPVEDARMEAQQLVRVWQRWVLDLVRHETGRRRRAGPPFRVNATALLVLVAVFTSRSFAPTAAELSVADELSAPDRALLDRVFANRALRDLAWQARVELGRRVRQLFDGRLDRYAATLDAAQVQVGVAERLRTAARATAAALDGAP